MPGFGAGPATGILGGRTVGLPVRPSFDLNLRSTLELRPRGGLPDARGSPMLRSRVRLCSHIRQALDRRHAGWLARGRSTQVGRRPRRTVLGLATRYASGAGWSRRRRRLAIPHRGRWAHRAASTRVAVARGSGGLRSRAVLAGHPSDGLGGLVALARYRRRSRLRISAVCGGMAVRRRCRGLVGGLGNERPDHLRGRSGRGGTTVVAGLSVLLWVRPRGIGRFWLIWLEAPGAGGGVGRSVHACSLVWPPSGRRAQPIGAEALPRRLSTTSAGPIPPAAAEG